MWSRRRRPAHWARRYRSLSVKWGRSLYMIEPDFSTNFNPSDAAADNGATLGADVPSELKPAIDGALDFLRDLYPRGPWAMTSIYSEPGTTETRTFTPSRAD